MTSTPKPPNPFPPLTRGETRFMLVRIDRGPDKRGAGSRTTAQAIPLTTDERAPGMVMPPPGAKNKNRHFHAIAGDPFARGEASSTGAALRALMRRVK